MINCTDIILGILVDALFSAIVCTITSFDSLCTINCAIDSFNYFVSALLLCDSLVFMHVQNKIQRKALKKILSVPCVQ